MLRQFGDCFDIDSGLNLVAADRVRIEHTEQARLVQPAEERLGEASAALDLVCSRGDQRPQVARPHNGAD
jgi:hypothetical protein